MTQVVRVGDIAVQVRGVTYQKQDAVVDRREGYVPLLRAGNITDSGLDLGDLLYVPPGKVSERQVLQQGDVLIAASSGSLEVVGKAAKVNDPGHFTFGAFCKVLRPSSKVDPNYFAQFFKTPAYRRTVSALAAGANINNLRNGDLDNLEIPLPPIDEQRRIAAILDKADEVRSKSKAALETLETLSQAIFIEMFGDPVANPMGWPRVELGNLASSRTESFNPLQATQELVELYSIPAFDAGRPIETIGSDIGSTKQLLQAGDVLLSKIVPHIRRAWVVGEDTGLRKVGSSEWIVFRGSECHPEFIRHLVTSDSFHNSFMRTVSGVGGSLLRARPSLVARVLVPLPPIQLQQEFGNAVTSVIGESLLLKKQGQGFAQLFASLQQKAFQGEL